MGSVLIFVVSGKTGIMEDRGGTCVETWDWGGTCVETCNGTELQLNGITFELGWVSKDQMNLSIKPYSQLL